MTMMIDSFTSDEEKQLLERESKSELSKVVKALSPLAVKLDPPHPSDWLYEHPEPGQTFEQYVNSNPTLASVNRNIIFLLPLGKFNDAQQRILNCAAEFLSCFFGLTVRIEDQVSLASVPIKMQRRHPEWGDLQILSKWVLDNFLAKQLPPDAATYRCLTTVDL